MALNLSRSFMLWNQVSIIGMDFSALKFWTLSMLMDVSFNEKKKIA